MFIISEISPQFGTDIELAEQMILQSKFGGANAVKLQLYPADKFVQNPGPYLKARELSRESYKRLVSYGRQIGIPVFATAFTNEMLDWCLEEDQPYYKVAARMHAEDPELVERIMSLDGAVFVSYPSDFPKDSIPNNGNCVNLYCVSQYPTLLEDLTLPDFNTSAFRGFSDHTIGISAAIMAAAQGCEVIEKHFTISRARQASVEKAHVGAMDVDELVELKKITLDFERIGADL